MTTENAKKPVISDKEKIAMLEAQLAEITKTQKDDQRVEEHVNIKIPLDEYIPVMSLLPYTLVLSTQSMGRGTVKKFEKFGEIKRILYKDLVDIMDVNPNFMKSGYYYILDQKVIRAHGLDEYYEKILTKDKIEEIISSNSKNGLELYKSSNPGQQEIIVKLLIEQVVKNPDSVDMNLIDSISRESKVDINEKVQYAVALNEQLSKPKS